MDISISHLILNIPFKRHKKNQNKNVWISALFFISVHPKRPTLTASPSSGTSMVGKNLELTCQTDSQGKQTTYTFYNGTKPVTTSNSSSNQHIINIQQAYEGQYFCEVTINGEKSEKSLPHQIRFIGELFVVALLVVNF